MKTKEEILNKVFIDHGRDSFEEGVDLMAISWAQTLTELAMQEYADQEKTALKENIKRELLTEWTWSDAALMSDVLKKIERL